MELDLLIDADFAPPVDTWIYHALTFWVKYYYYRVSEHKSDW